MKMLYYLQRTETYRKTATETREAKPSSNVLQHKSQWTVSLDRRGWDHQYPLAWHRSSSKSPGWSTVTRHSFWIPYSHFYPKVCNIKKDTKTKFTKIKFTICLFFQWICVALGTANKIQKSTQQAIKPKEIVQEIKGFLTKAPTAPSGAHDTFILRLSVETIFLLLLLYKLQGLYLKNVRLNPQGYS